MPTLLFLGDSLAAGYDWQARIPAQQVVNLATPGSTTRDLWATLPSLKGEIDPPDIIMVAIGTNDLLAGDLDFFTPLKEILVRLRHDYPRAEILVSSLFPLSLPYLASGTLPAINRRIEELATQTGCCYLDMHHRLASAGDQIFQADGVHITAAAYEIWARALLEHIAFLVEDD
jgi:lysophospholipase L1-like esterase